MFAIAGKDYATDEYRLRARCSTCGEVTEVRVPSQALFWYNHGKLIQECFHMLTPGERELLKTNICRKCFDKMFGFMDDGDEEQEEDE